MAIVETIVTALWLMLPAYVPNNAAVIVGGGATLDGGRTWQGRRLLGDGKTWRGTIGGITAGAGLAVVLNELAPLVLFGASLPAFPTAVVISLPAGAMVGDIAASFLKRRLDRERGAAVPLLDQLDFVVGALVLTAIVTPDWFGSAFELEVLVVVFVLTPLLHLGTNAVGYLLGLKPHPW